MAYLAPSSLQGLLPRFLINIIKSAAYRVYKIGQKAITPPLDKYDFQTFDLLKKILPHDANCIDIGAHTADILKKIIKYAPDGTHYAFEPIPRLYYNLQRKYGKKAKVYEMALSSEAGEATFNVCRDRPAISGLKLHTFPGKSYEFEQIHVKVETLDRIIPEALPVHIIKIDVEGAELHVLKGAERILKRNKPIILFEFGLGASDLYGSKPHEMFDYLQECGLSVSTLEYYLQGRAMFNRDEFIGQYEKKYNYFFIAYNADSR